MDQSFTVVSAEQVARYLVYVKINLNIRIYWAEIAEIILHVRAEETSREILVMRLKFGDSLKSG